ncbi:basic phospholipase A2-like [Littorina saxatilis]|uniref:Phospholipase A2 n=1 Tax=Littorina saxatilis TaxID=31220 RepID=A0AAN9BL04_9CAEN
MNTSSILAVLAFLLQLGVGSSLSAHRPRRTKRTILQMCELIQRYTNRGCLDYNDYGCFCGWGNAGSGRKHLDDVDACCLLHDNCYGEVTCMWFYPQLVGFSIQCGDDNSCQCQDSRVWSPCARSVCECDLRFAECLGRATYHEHHRSYDWHLCHHH